jgi:hypothetical protein
MKRMMMILMALSVLVGFMGCSSDDGGVPDTAGRLTLNGLENFNGKYAMARGTLYTGEYFVAAASVSSDLNSGTAGQINNGSVTLKVWGWSDDSLYSFNENGSVYVEVGIFASATFNENSEPIAERRVQVNFSNGVASGYTY